MSFEAIFDVRCRIAEVRQPEHAPALSALRKALDDMKVSHPYQLDRAVVLELFGGGSTAEGLPVLGLDSYLYRLTSVRSLVDAVTTWHGVSKHLPDQALFDAIRARFTGEPWLPLETFADGWYVGHRGFSWWAALDFEPTLASAQRAGLPSDWVASHAVILRCRAADLPSRHVRVPSCVDAYDSNIFHPTITRDNPASGVAIDLSQIDALAPGVEEYVIRTMPVQRLDVRLALVDAKMRAEFPLASFDPELLSSLRVYYDQLI